MRIVEVHYVNSNGSLGEKPYTYGADNSVEVGKQYYAPVRSTVKRVEVTKVIEDDASIAEFINTAPFPISALRVLGIDAIVEDELQDQE